METIMVEHRIDGCWRYVCRLCGNSLTEWKTGPRKTFCYPDQPDVGVCDCVKEEDSATVGD